MTERSKIKQNRIKYPGRLAWGLALCLLASGIYLSCYGLFRTRVEEMYQEDESILAMQYTTDWLMENTYLLYRDLRQKGASEPVDYRTLYVHPKEGCEWVLDEEERQRWIFGEAVEGPIQLPADAGRVYEYLMLLDQHFVFLENYFTNLNATFGYSCEDVVTGERVGNLEEGEMRPEDQYFYLSFLFDAYGNCTVEHAACGDNPTDIRKRANLSARETSLEHTAIYTDLDQAADIGLDSYMTLGGPSNCRVTYCLSNAEWERLKRGAVLRIRDGEYSIGGDSYYGYFVCGADELLICLGLFVLFGAIYLPMAGSPQESGGGTPLRLSRSPEFLSILALLECSLGTAAAMHLLYGIMSGTALEAVRKYAGDGMDSLIKLELYAVNLVFLMGIFAVFWYMGVNLREIRSLGVRGYIKKRSVFYQIFPFIKSKLEKTYDCFQHFDVTRNANKMIWKLVLINGVILFFISSLWMGGLAVALIYSIFLFIVLRKYISDLQKKYSILLKAINEIAQGNPNVLIKEDLGVFEPFRPQLQRIQQGFRSAVAEEVKSQRMRAELVTNVSHDLKTPLTAIITYINLLKEEQVTQEQRREYLDTLERKSLRLKALIEDLFEISKADSQNMSLNLVDVDIMNLVKQVAFEMGDKLAGQNLDLRMDLPEGKILLPLDSQRTYRIYENLFGNIAKYAMPGTRVYVTGRVQEGRVILVLKNITAQEISVNPQELTERFVRGDASRNTEGSGLGLAIAKSFVQLQGGSLELEVDGDLFKAITIWKME